MPEPTPQASVIVPTRNRKDLLRGVIASSMAQSVPVELIVMDDGSTDGTDKMMAKEFPHVLYRRFEGPNGPAFLRNRGAELATTEFLFPVDDDVSLPSPETVRQTIAEFSDPRIGAIGIPYINTRINQQVRQKSPDDREVWLTSAFVGASHAVRRSVFLAVGGYREHWFYMGEEGDLCLRLLNRGIVTRFGSADPILHYESPVRNSKWSGLYGRRNDILGAWENAPLARLPDRLASATLNGLRHGLRRRRLMNSVQGLAWGYGSIFTHLPDRQPVSPKIFRLFRRLSHQPLPMNDVAPLLPPLQGN